MSSRPSSLFRAGADLRRRIADVKDAGSAPALHRRAAETRVSTGHWNPIGRRRRHQEDARHRRPRRESWPGQAALRAGLTAQDDVDLRGVVSRVSARHVVLARASQVTVEMSVPDEPVVPSATRPFRSGVGELGRERD